MGAFLAIALPLCAALMAMAAFQLGAGLAKPLFDVIGTAGAASLRLTLGAAMLLLIVRPWRGWPRDASLRPVLVLGACMAGAIQMFYMALNRLPLALVVSLQFIGPLAVAIWTSRKRNDFLWIALAATGIWQVLSPPELQTSLDWFGILMALGSAACWAGYILSGRASGNTFGRSAACIALGIAAVVILPAGIHQGGASLLSLDVLPRGIAIAALSAALPFTLELYALPRLPARTFAVFTSVEPVLGVCVGF